VQLRNTGGQGITTVNTFHSRIITTGGARIDAVLFQPVATIITGSAQPTCNAVFFSDLVCSVNLPAGGVVITSPLDRSHAASHMSQGPAFTVGENCYLDQSGTGAGNWGIFGLAAGAVGVQVNIAAALSWSTGWGSGNDATSIPLQLAQGSTYSTVGVGGASNFGGMVASGVGCHMLMGNGTTIDVPLAALPASVRAGTLRVVKMFSAVCGNAESGITGYMDDAASAAVLGASSVPLRYPTSARCVVRLRLSASTGTGAHPPTATLYRNGAATPMTCTLGAGAAAGDNVVDSAHPVLFADGDTLDVQIASPTASEGAKPFTATLEELS